MKTWVFLLLVLQATSACGENSYSYTIQSFAKELKDIRGVKTPKAEAMLAKLFEITNSIDQSDPTKRFLRLGFTNQSELIFFAFISWHEIPNASADTIEMWMLETRSEPEKHENLALPSNEVFSFNEAISSMRDERLSSARLQSIIARLQKMGWGKKATENKQLSRSHDNPISIIDGNINGTYYYCIAPVDDNTSGDFLHRMVRGFFDALKSR